MQSAAGGTRRAACCLQLWCMAAGMSCCLQLGCKVPERSAEQAGLYSQ